jgi:hypothetical protein
MHFRGCEPSRGLRSTPGCGATRRSREHAAGPSPTHRSAPAAHPPQQAQPAPLGRWQRRLRRRRSRQLQAQPGVPGALGTDAGHALRAAGSLGAAPSGCHRPGLQVAPGASFIRDRSRATTGLNDRGAIIRHGPDGRGGVATVYRGPSATTGRVRGRRALLSAPRGPSILPWALALHSQEPATHWAAPAAHAGRASGKNRPAAAATPCATHAYCAGHGADHAGRLPGSWPTGVSQAAAGRRGQRRQQADDPPLLWGAYGKMTSSAPRARSLCINGWPGRRPLRNARRCTRTGMHVALRNCYTAPVTRRLPLEFPVFFL